MKLSLNQIEGMIKNYEEEGWFCLPNEHPVQGRKVEVISDLVEEVKALRNELKIAEAEIKRLQDIPRITHTHINAIRGTKEKIEL